MASYAALIVDVVNSKKYAITIRNDLQKTIIATVEILNNAFQSVLIKPVAFSSGDEVQGLFRESVYAYLYFRLLEIGLLPRKIRGGIGYGEWTTRMENQGTQAQDGPAYHLARSAIECAKGMKTQRLCFEDGMTDTWLLNVYLNASYPLLQALSKGQLQVFQILEGTCPFNDQEKLDGDVLVQLLNNGRNQNPLKHLQNINLTEAITQSPETSVMVKNVSEIIAAYYHTTRQNVYNLTQKGNLLHIRILDYCAACALLGRKEHGRYA